MARSSDGRVEGRLAQLEAIFRSGGYEFTDQDRGHLRDYLRNNDGRPRDDGRPRYQHLIDSEASGLAHAAAAFEWQSRIPLDDPRAVGSLAQAHYRLFQYTDSRAGQPSGQRLPLRASEARENLRNLSDPKPFARAAGEYYAAVSAAAPYGKGSEVAAQLFVDRQAQAAGHSVDWQLFHRERNAAVAPLLAQGTGANQEAISERAFSAAILLRQFRPPEARSGQQRQASRRAGTRRQSALGRLRSGLGLGHRPERTGRDTRGAQRTR